MFEIESNVVVKQYGVRPQIWKTMEALKVGDSFVVPIGAYAAVGTRATVSEYAKKMRAKGDSFRRYRTSATPTGVRVYRVE